MTNRLKERNLLFNTNQFVNIDSYMYVHVMFGKNPHKTSYLRKAQNYSNGSRSK